MTHAIPANLKYTTSHEWIREDDNDIITLGITDHAQSLLGDVVFVELPEANKILNVGEGCAVVESVKAAADVYCPIAGELVEINEDLTKQPELINQDPYEKGWICRVRVKDKSSLTTLMSASEYENSMENEAI